MDWRPITANSHITEPPNCYIDNIDPAWREKSAACRPQGRHGRHLHRGRHEDARADGPDRRGRRAAQGHPHRGREIRGSSPQWLGSPKRLIEQDRDGVAAEMIYPTVGMMLCGHPDAEYKRACFDAYNAGSRHMSARPQPAARPRPDGGAQRRGRGRGFRRIKEWASRRDDAGEPPEEDYDDLSFDPLWRTAIELGLPLSSTS